VCKPEQRLEGVLCRNQHSAQWTTDEQPAVVMINSSVANIEFASAEIAASIVDREQETARETGQPWARAESRVEGRHERSDVGHTAADAGERRRNDIPDALVGYRREKPSFAHRTNEAVGHGVGQAA
jgi:hypothetical protein